MAKDTVNDYSATPGNNSDIAGTNIAENCSPANLNNALREGMADIADVIVGNVRATNWYTTSLNVSGTATIGTLSITALSAATLSLSGNGTIGGTLGVSGAITGSSTITGTVMTGNRFVADGSTAATNGMYLPAANTLGFSSNSTERLRFNASGAWGLAGATYGTSGQILTSNGDASPPTWQSAAAGYDPVGDVTAPGFSVALPVNSAAATVTIQASTATTGGFGSVAVTFPTAFTVAPYVNATVVLTTADNLLCNIEDVTTTGMTIWVYDTASNEQAGKVVHWMAIGPTA
jgi:hypothetical protein